MRIKIFMFHFYTEIIFVILFSELYWRCAQKMAPFIVVRVQLTLEYADKISQNFPISSFMTPVDQLLRADRLEEYTYLLTELSPS
jgi:hypothetical protein